MKEKELLLILGEETIHSAKGHFKAADIRRNLVIGVLWTCLLLNGLRVFELPSLFGRVLSSISLIGTLALLRWEVGSDKDYRARHKQVGEEYLALHKKIRECFFLSSCESYSIQELSQEVIQLDQTSKPEIPIIARKWAKRAIEKSGETDNWFLNK